MRLCFLPRSVTRGTSDQEIHLTHLFGVLINDVTENGKPRDVSLQCNKIEFLT